MIKLPQAVTDVIAAMNAKGFDAYAVGGSVRDTLLGRETHGWDFTTNATPEQILEIFPESFYDNTFGTVGIKIYPDTLPGQTPEQDEQSVSDIFEITTYRSEGNYRDKRHPDSISWGNNVEDDLSRRDFTINAIATDGKTIIDPYDGKTDLHNKLIRTVRNPDERFSEDALRLMRAVRFAAQLGFLIETATLESIQRNAAGLQDISQERIRDELLKILASPYPADGIRLLRTTNLLHYILPEFDDAFATPQKSPKRHHKYDVGTHSVEALHFCPSPDPIVRLATLLHDIGKPKTFNRTPEGVITFYNHEVVGARMVKHIAQRLRLSKHDSQRLITLVRWHQFTVDEHQTDSAVRRFIRRIGKENIQDMLALRTGDRLGGGASETSWRLELFQKRIEEVQYQPFSVADLVINGNDVMTRCAITPGPMVGKILAAVFAQVENQAIPNEREALLAVVDSFMTPDGIVLPPPAVAEEDEDWDSDKR